MDISKQGSFFTIVLFPFLHFKFHSLKSKKDYEQIDGFDNTSNDSDLIVIIAMNFFKQKRFIFFSPNISKKIIQLLISQMLHSIVYKLFQFS